MFFFNEDSETPNYFYNIKLSRMKAASYNMTAPMLTTHQLCSESNGYLSCTNHDGSYHSLQTLQVLIQSTLLLLSYMQTMLVGSIDNLCFLLKGCVCKTI